MAYARARRRQAGTDYWPGFVDAMATLLLVVTFLLSVFMIAQYFVTQESSGKDSALARLNAQIAELNELLSLAQSERQSVSEELASVSASLSSERQERLRLQGLLSTEREGSSSASARLSAIDEELSEEKKISAGALAKIELLNQQLVALRRQIAALQDALEASEEREEESQTRIADLGKRLNIALAKKVQELARYRSDFFGRLSEVLGQREDIQIVGDRFVFQAEVLFPSGSDQINPEGKEQLNKLATALLQLEDEIPQEINWVLRIDGHTDIRPISTPRFPSNWELSSARAISVVKHLVSQGVSSRRLVAAGFGEFQPITYETTDEALRRNRRIELKLTEK